MKKVICMVLVLMVTLSLALPVFAAEGEFVPSITYKDAPDIKKAEMDGDDVTPCIVVTSVGGARNKSTDITQDERNLLLAVYEDLKNGKSKLPINEDYVIRDLVDLSYEHDDCRILDEHGQKDQKLQKKGVTLTVDFDLGVSKYTDVIVMTYIDGKWTPIESVTNNGNGTVTCVFEDICPVVFALKQSQYGGNAQTGDAVGQNMGLWIGVFAVSGAALVAAVVVYSKRRKHV